MELSVTISLFGNSAGFSHFSHLHEFDFQNCFRIRIGLGGVEVSSKHCKDVSDCLLDFHRDSKPGKGTSTKVFLEVCLDLVSVKGTDVVFLGRCRIGFSRQEEIRYKKRLLYEAGHKSWRRIFLADTLGTKTRYRKGMGYGFVCSQPTKRVCNSEALKNAHAQIEEQITMIDSLRSELGTLKDNLMKLQADMNKILAIFGNYCDS